MKRQVKIEYPDESKVEVNKIVINLGGEIDRIRVRLRCSLNEQ